MASSRHMSSVIGARTSSRYLNWKIKEIGILIHSQQLSMYSALRLWTRLNVGMKYDPPHVLCSICNVCSSLAKNARSLLNMHLLMRKLLTLGGSFKFWSGISMSSKCMVWSRCIFPNWGTLFRHFKEVIFDLSCRGTLDEPSIKVICDGMTLLAATTCLNSEHTLAVPLNWLKSKNDMHINVRSCGIFHVHSDILTHLRFRARVVDGIMDYETVNKKNSPTNSVRHFFI